ncbi:unnamed protein product [Phytophthora lilii]|uniref:Unnamed protein product n=1 Tax=Phytophthora lilii TaxID=2077276 RepID=A0A9W7CPR6_9STRA|nr:unnamed protein product [Phytophthora lilii]
MGFTARPPSQESTIFNPNYYALATDVLSLEMADTLYLSKTDYRMSYLSSITLGQAAPMSALVVDANRNISGINSISCSSIQLNGSSIDLSNLSLLSANPGTATASKAIILNSNKEIATLNSIDSVLYKQNGVAYDLSVLSATAGTVSASKALIADTSYGITGLRSLTVSGSGFNKSLVIQNDSTTVSASMNIVSSYQMEFGVRPSASSTTPNCAFIRYVLSDRLLIHASGNVSIGGTSVNTSYKLDVAGAINCSSLYLNGVQPDFSNISLLSSTPGTASPSKALVLDSSSTISGIKILRLKSTSTAALLGSATLDQYDLVVKRDIASAYDTPIGIGFLCSSISDSSIPGAAICHQRNLSAIGSGGDLLFATRSTSSATGSCTERMRITYDGHVSIGTQSTGSHLTVQSDGSQLYGSWERAFECWNSKATPIKAGMIIYGENGGTNSNGVSFGTYTNDPLRFMVNGANIVKINSSSRMGVALSNDSPEATIHSGGQVWANDYMHIKSNANTAMYRWNWPATNYPAIGNEDGSLGRIRIGSCNASFVWQAYSPVYGGSYTNASDQRYKKDIEDIPYGLNQVMQLKPRRFVWRDSNEVAIGFIAQEVLGVLPEPVHVPEDPDTLNDQGMPCNGLGVDYSSLTSILCKAIQELKAELDELRSIISNA